MAHWEASHLLRKAHLHMMGHSLRPWCLAGTVMLATVSAATAHPHVWSDMRSSVIVRPGGLISGVRVEWTFDKSYSAVATQGLDANGDGVYSDAELAPLTALNLSSLKTYGYFIFMRMNGTLQKFTDPIEPGQSYAGGKLTLRFTLPLQHPVDPHRGTFALKVYDPEYFIDFEYAKTKPANVMGALPRGCTMKLSPIPSNEQLNQTLAMLSTKPVDWKPDGGEDFGGLFAQAVTVKCTP
jgi:ABC-type uncharacterized transport system substrate-binding protein